MIKMISQSGKKAYGVNEYVVDTYNEIEEVPKNCEMGSTILVIETKTVYIKNGAGKWVDL